MKKTIFNRLLSLLLCFVMLFGLLGTVAYAQEPQKADPQGSAAFSEGTYTTILTKPVMSGRVTYGIEIVFAKGNYTYTTSIFLSGMSDDGMNGDQGTDTYSGTYTVNGASLTMSGGNLSSGTVQSDGSLELNGVLSRYAFNKSSTFTVKRTGAAPEVPETYEDNLKAGKYALTAEDYPASAAMKLPAYITIDTAAKTLRVQAASDLADKGFGTYTFDETTGVYTVTYTADTTVGAQTTFTFANDAITFTSPLYYGKARINVLDDDGNFIPYTAKLTKDTTPEVPETYEDNLKAGKYALTAEDYPESAMMKLPAYITIDTAAKTLRVQAASDLADKGFGAYTFDETTGVYTVTYTADTTVGAQTTFTFANDAITFTSPLYYGKARINVLDDNGNFIPYTAKLTKDTTPEVPETYEDNLKAGKYALTAEDYPESAMMKLPAYITIDTAAKTLKVQAASDLADKGFGTYTFDETTGVYTVTYTADTTVGAQTTFTFANDAITFTSPLYYGKARINVLDDNGNFIPYTAKLTKDTTPEVPETYEDNLKAGKYALTAEDYPESAMMKLPAYITIDTAAKTLRVQAASDLADKGFGTYTFDETTGVYTVTYTADTTVGAQTTFTFANDAITFTSPLYYGKARINVLDDDGNFIPYTAKLTKDDGGEDPATPFVYAILDGANGTVAQGAAVEYRLRANGPAAKLAAIGLDGEAISAEAYQLSGESETVIVLTAEFMKSLSAGTHTIRLMYVDGSVETTLTVRQVTDPVEPNPGDGSAPKTGDSAPVAMWLLAGGMSVCAAAALSVSAKKKQKHN